MNSKDDERINILLVDDRPENLFALKAILSRPSYNLVTATNGREALGKLLKHDFALILLDVFMPDMDGYEVAMAIKKRSKNQHIPIIFLTAMAKEIHNIYRAYDIGAVDYIQKPLEANIVRAKVAVFAELYRKSQQIKHQAELLRQSEVRQKELELQTLKRESEKKFQDLVEGIDHGIVWSADPRTLSFSYVSPRAELVLGYPLTSWFEESGFWNNHIYPSDRKFVLENFEKARNGKEISFDHRFFTAGGEIVWLHTGVRLARRGQEQGYEIRGLSMDITALKHTEEALRSAVKMRDEFLSIASHELKTPITPIKLHIQMISRILQKKDPSQLKSENFSSSVNTLNRQIDRLSHLVDTLLDVSRISAGNMRLSPEEIDLLDLVREIVDRYQDQAERACCRVEVLSNEPIHVFWDRLRTEQVLVNLIVNAIKYGAGKPIEIRLSSVGEIAEIHVRDFGIGIKKEDQARIFQRFERAVSPTSFGGLGLGLYITQQIVLAHGGTIQVESQPEKGSTFTVRIPLRLSLAAVA